MSWVYRFSDQHKCSPPEFIRSDAGIRPGDVWRCDDCSLIHVRQDSQRDGQYWEAAAVGSKLFARTITRLESLGVDTTPLRGLPSGHSTVAYVNEIPPA